MAKKSGSKVANKRSTGSAASKAAPSKRIAKKTKNAKRKIPPLMLA